jgi:hypothetical protein
MAERHAELILALQDLGAGLDLRPGGDPAAAAVARIHAGTGTGTAGEPEAGPGHRERRRVALVALAVAAVVVLVVTALPGPRAALARLLGIGGVEVTTGAELAPGLDRTFDLGDPVEVDHAVARFPGDAAALVDELGRPAQAWTGRPEGAVSLVWPDSDRLPGLGDTGAGLVLTAFPTSETPEITKLSTTSGAVDPVNVGGHQGMWVSGPHEMAFTTPHGEPAGARLAGHTLVWTDGHTTYRLESEVTRSQAIELAARLV